MKGGQKTVLGGGNSIGEGHPEQGKNMDILESWRKFQRVWETGGKTSESVSSLKKIR